MKTIKITYDESNRAATELVNALKTIRLFSIIEEERKTINQFESLMKWANYFDYDEEERQWILENDKSRYCFCVTADGTDDSNEFRCYMSGSTFPVDIYEIANILDFFLHDNESEASPVLQEFIKEHTSYHS